jgi:methylphosphotriester-DNA--protein-cysteine methyltransferase
MHYCEVAPSFDLAHIVLSYSEFTVDEGAPAPIVHEVIPDGCASFVYHRNTGSEVAWLRVVGPRLISFRTEVKAGDTYWNARLTPAACRQVLGRAPESLQNQILPFSNLLPHLADELFRRLNESRNFAEAIAAYDATLRSLELKEASVDTKVTAAVRFIEASQGRAKIAEVARTVGLSMRQLERRFRAVSGLTPKQFARVRRVRATALALVEEGRVDWAARAAEMGYADQSHLTREFVNVTGRSPVTFAEDLAKIKHGNLVK